LFQQFDTAHFSYTNDCKELKRGSTFKHQYFLWNKFISWQSTWLCRLNNYTTEQPITGNKRQPWHLQWGNSDWLDWQELQMKAVISTLCALQVW